MSDDTRRLRQLIAPMVQKAVHDPDPNVQLYMKLLQVTDISNEAVGQLIGILTPETQKWLVTYAKRLIAGEPKPIKGSLWHGD